MDHGSQIQESFTFLFPQDTEQCALHEALKYSLWRLFFSVGLVVGPKTTQLHHFNPLKLSRLEYKNRMNLLFGPNFKSSVFLWFQRIGDVATELAISHSTNHLRESWLWSPELQFQKGALWSVLINGKYQHLTYFRFMLIRQYLPCFAKCLPRGND